MLDLAATQLLAALDNLEAHKKLKQVRVWLELLLQHTESYLAMVKVKLLIEDQCTPNESSQAAKIVSLSPVHNYPSGDFNVNVNKLLHELQKSKTSIDGQNILLFLRCLAEWCITLEPVKMAFPDLKSPGYKHYFVKMSQPAVSLEDVLTRLAHLTISISGTIQLVVEHVSVMVLSLLKSTYSGALGQYPLPWYHALKCHQVQTIWIDSVPPCDGQGQGQLSNYKW